MGDHSAIEWTDATWNPLTGCTRVSRGCDNCYAATQAAGRLKNTPAYEGLAVITPSGRAAFNGRIRLLPERLEQPLRWRRRRRVFVNSMSDLFHPEVPDEFIDQVFAVMALADRHVFQVLTKRPERAAKYMAGDWTRPLAQAFPHHRVARLATQIAQERGEDTSSPWWDLWLEQWPLRNVWLGTSVEDQPAADLRIPELLRTPAAVRFLSMEPLLGPVDLSAYLEFVTIPDAHDSVAPLQWIIVGGESGRGARPMHPDWARSLRDQCVDAGVPFFFKQWGEYSWRRGESYHNSIATTAGIQPERVGKKAAGRELDGRTWDEFPEVANA